jgi:hypothetical protein
VSPASDGCEEPVNPDRRMESRRAGAGAVVTQCTFIEITTAITPKDPMTVRTTKQRSKKNPSDTLVRVLAASKAPPLKKGRGSIAPARLEHLNET